MRMTNGIRTARVSAALSLASLAGLALLIAGCDGSTTSAESSAAATPQPAANVTQPDAATTPAAPLAAADATPKTVDVDPFIAPDDPLPPNQVTGEGPQITFTNNTHDFGKIWDIREHRTSFGFRNTGTETLTIQEVKASCGCTALQLDKKVFAPGEGDYIRVSFNPKGNGRQTKDITVVSNAANIDVKHLSISADIVPVVTIEPSIYVRFGAVNMNEDHTTYFDVVGRYPDVIIDSVDAPNPSISAQVVEDDGTTPVYLPSPAKPRHKVAVTLYRGPSWGGFYTTVNVRTRSTNPATGEQIPHMATVHVSASLFGEVQGSDTMFRVGATPPRTPFQRVITLTRTNGQPWTISKALLEKASMPGMKVTVDPIDQPNIAGYRITLSGDPGEYMGPVNGRVLIMTDVPGEEQIFIPIAGIVRNM